MLPFLAKLVVHDPYRVQNVWQSMCLTRDELGNPVYEWWNGDRKLTLYINDEGTKIHWLKVPWHQATGIDDIEDGDIDSLEGFMSIWDWLHYDHPKVDDLSWARSGIDD